jgi:hypothetical protein
LCQALVLCGVNLVKGVCNRFVVVHGRTLRYGALVCGAPQERSHTFEENRAVGPFGLRQDTQDGKRAVKCHSGQDGRGFGEAEGIEDNDATVERRHQHDLVAFAVAVGDGFAKVADRTGYVAVACPQLGPDREYVPKYRAARARPGERD